MPIARKPASRLDPMGCMDFDQGGCIVETSRRRRVPEILDAHDGCDAVARRATKVRQPALEWNISDTNRFTLKATPVPVGTRGTDGSLAGRVAGWARMLRTVR